MKIAMRNSKRIKKILNLIEKIWNKYPDLRLCQLISNSFNFRELNDSNMYYLEDDKLESLLIDFYEIKNAKNNYKSK
jgi:hypothetical protein